MTAGAQRREVPYRQMAERLPYAMVVHLAGDIVFANVNAQRIAGGTLVGRSIDSLFAPPYLKGIREVLLGLRPEDADPHQHREHMTRIDGTRVEVEVASTPFVNDRAAHVQVVFHDIAPRTRAERRVEAQRLAALARLAGGVAHQFNNVLATVLARASVLRAEPATPEGRDDLSAIITASLRGGEVVSRLLGFARSGAYQRQRIDVAMLVKNAATRAEKYARLGVGIETDLSSASTEPLTIIGDQHQLASTLDALVDNALEAMGAHGNLVMQMHGAQLQAEAIPDEDVAPGMFVCVACIDDGVGMSTEACARAIEPYVSTRGDGRGLGLSMVQGVVANHGGFFRLTSEVSRGTRAEIWLPVASAPPVAPPPPPSLPPRVLTHQGLVLVIDDEALVRASARRVLTHLGYTVADAADGVTGLALFAASPDAFCGVLLDLRMPGMSGDVVLPRLIALRPDVAVILCTGYALDYEVEELLSLGHVRFLQKPYTIGQLTAELVAFAPAAAQT